MNIFEKIENIVEQTLQEMPFWRENENLPAIRIKLETPRDKTHGELSSNIAMILAKILEKHRRILLLRYVPILRVLS